MLEQQGQKTKENLMDMGTSSHDTECNTQARTSGKQSNVLLAGLFEIGEIDGSLLQMKISGYLGRWPKVGPKGSEKQACWSGPTI